MMGQLPGGQQRLFYSFNLEEHVPPQHLLRSIDQCLDLSDLHAHLADFYSPIGHPSKKPDIRGPGGLHGPSLRQFPSLNIRLLDSKSQRLATD